MNYPQTARFSSTLPLKGESRSMEGLRSNICSKMLEPIVHRGMKELKYISRRLESHRNVSEVMFSRQQGQVSRY